MPILTVGIRIPVMEAGIRIPVLEVSDLVAVLVPPLLQGRMMMIFTCWKEREDD
jgi:hypothetical protein